MLSVKATFQGGVARPVQPVHDQEGKSAIIVFLDEDHPRTPSEEAGWSELEDLLDDCQVETGIPDLADEHDHYIHGAKKRR